MPTAIPPTDQVRIRACVGVNEAHKLAQLPQKNATPVRAIDDDALLPEDAEVDVDPRVQTRIGRLPKALAELTEIRGAHLHAPLRPERLQRSSHSLRPFVEVHL